MAFVSTDSHSRVKLFFLLTPLNRFEADGTLNKMLGMERDSSTSQRPESGSVPQ